MAHTKFARVGDAQGELAYAYESDGRVLVATITPAWEPRAGERNIRVVSTRERAVEILEEIACDAEGVITSGPDIGEPADPSVWREGY